MISFFLQVTYTARRAGEEGFLRKNKDELHAKLPTLLAGSGWSFVRGLFFAREADAKRQEVK